MAIPSQFKRVGPHVGRIAQTRYPDCAEASALNLWIGRDKVRRESQPNDRAEWQTYSFQARSSGNNKVPNLLTQRRRVESQSLPVERIAPMLQEAPKRYRSVSRP